MRLNKKILGLDKYEDNIDTIGVKDLLEEFMNEIEIPIEENFKKIIELEYISRDGFYAHSWNRGGFDLICITPMRYILGSGIAPSHVHAKCQEVENEAIDEILKDNPQIDDTSDEFYQKLDDYMTSEYNEVAFRVRCMYEGNGILKIYAGFDFDAPYFRWRDVAKNEFEVTFRNRTELKNKLKKILKKIND